MMSRFLGREVREEKEEVAERTNGSNRDWTYATVWRDRLLDVDREKCIFNIDLQLGYSGQKSYDNGRWLAEEFLSKNTLAENFTLILSGPRDFDLGVQDVLQPRRVLVHAERRFYPIMRVKG